MSPAHRLARVLSWLVLALVASLAQAQSLPATTAVDDSAPRIGVVTMTPGTDYWARFGHDAIVVSDPVSGQQLSYNYGYFDFDQPGFFARFLRGKMLYQLVVMPLDQDLASYAAEGRGASLQWLNLTPAQARAVLQYLNWNALPENADYHYDYFTANCSTKVRDVLDRALDGELKNQLSGRSHGLSYRSEALRLADGVWWMYLGMHVALSDFADKPLSLWQEAFVPRRLADALDETRASDGTALVSARAQLLPDRLGLEAESPTRLRGLFIALGVILALALGFLLRPTAGTSQRRLGTVLSMSFWLLCSSGGLVLLGVWLLTSHTAGWGNENLLLLNPLCLALLPTLPSLARGRDVGTLLRMLTWLILAAAAFALFLRFLPFRLQENTDFVVLLLPAHIVLAWRLLGRKPS